MKYRTFSFTDNIYEWLSRKSQGIEADTKKIEDCLNSDAPCLIARYGSVELQALLLMRYIPFSLPIARRSFRHMKNNAGFFPVSFGNLRKFYNRYKEDTKLLDLLISWRIEELFLRSWFANKLQVKKTTFDYFFRQERPWTYALKDKKILVVHPFAETIEDQYYRKRELLFKNKKVLPEFKSLQTIKAVQSIAGNPVGFDTWFDALEWMKNEINNKDFDIALIGCGAYALPLAAHVKRLGKKGVHMGGVLQFLFGIKSVRYEEDEEYVPYINEHFVYPRESDKPKNASLVEGGCYWGR